LKRVLAALCAALLVLLTSCPVDPTEPGTEDTETTDPDGTTDGPIDLGVLYYDGQERSFSGRFPGSSTEVRYRLRIDGGTPCVVGSKYRLEVRLLPSECFDYSLALYDASNHKLMGESDLADCVEEEIEVSWKCEDNTYSREFLVIVASTDGSVSASPFTLSIKPLKVKLPK
jgi:hypothetical protein